MKFMIYNFAENGVDADFRYVMFTNDAEKLAVIIRSVGIIQLHVI